jgi:hypothetical protein
MLGNSSAAEGLGNQVVSRLVRKGIGKTILVTGCGCLQDCETSMISNFLDNWLTDGCEFVSLTCRQPKKIPGTHSC